MRVPLSDIVRKIASAIELDITPTDTELKEKKEERLKSSNPGVGRSKDDESKHDVVKPTARPKIKPTRRKPSYMHKDWDSKSYRRDYMREWRSQGKDVETGNKYIKKNKIK